jgi:hypothetical protein
VRLRDLAGENAFAAGGVRFGYSGWSYMKRNFVLVEITAKFSSVELN